MIGENIAECVNGDPSNGNTIDQHVSDAELQRYYNEYRDLFDRVTVRASHIVLRVGPAAPESQKSALPSTG